MHFRAAMDGMDSSTTETPDGAVAAAMCHEILQPLTCLLASLEQAHEALRQRAPDGIDQPSMRLARWLADAHATAQHIARVVADVDGQARQEPRHTRTLDLRSAVRAAAAMAQPGRTDEADILIDAPRPAWVDGVDTRLVHVFLELFADAYAEQAALLVRMRCDEHEVVTELRYGTSRSEEADERPRPVRGDAAVPTLDRALVRHIVAAHRGHIVRWPMAGNGVLARVTLPLSPRDPAVDGE